MPLASSATSGSYFQQRVAEDARGRAALSDEQMAYADNNYFPFILRPCHNLRALLFRCLDVLVPVATYRDDAFTQALAWIKSHRSSHKERMFIQPGAFDLQWLPEKWQRLCCGGPMSPLRESPVGHAV